MDVMARLAQRMGVKIVLFLTLATGLSIAVKKRVWKDVH